MADNSKIEWTDATFNPWIGCTKVSAACDHCYAERWGARFGVSWGNHPRRRTSKSYWAQPLKWNAAAGKAGVRKSVFCASLADWLDNQVDPVWRHELGILIAGTPHLDWLLLTKRPQNYEALAPWPANDPPANVSLGTTIENQSEADRRIPEILRWPAKWHFISAEPLLGPVDLDQWLGDARLSRDGARYVEAPARGLDWVIAGGESGPNARPMHPDWAGSLRDQCAAAGVAFHFKQWGAWLPGENLGPERNPSWPLARWQDGNEGKHPSPDHIEWRHFTTPGEYGAFAIRVGKAAAGRLLDGRTHEEFPA